MFPNPDTHYAMRRAEHPHLVREAARDHQAALAQGTYRQSWAIGRWLSAVGYQLSAKRGSGRAFPSGQAFRLPVVNTQ